MDRNKIHVYSEIGKLKKVILHRPGEEIENLTPELLERLLFDDIPFLKIAREEHDAFAKVLENNGVQVLYLEKLAAEAVENKEIKEKFLNQVINESGIDDNNLKDTIKNYLNSFATKTMIDKIMAGIRKKEIGIKEQFNDYPFIMDPMPNLYFTRDPFALIGNGVSINSMRTKTRKRETIFGEYIFKYHPEFKENEVPLYYNRYETYNIEGGDELVLSDKVLAIGNSERTDKEAVEVLAKSIFESGETFETILMFNIPKIRAFMHLDTVFTMIDHDKFTVHPGIEGELKVIAMTYNKKDNSINMKEEEGTVDAILSKYLNKDISVIRCGGGDKIISGREQWNDGSNTLAIAPGKVITYERNYVTNEILDKNNIKVITIASSELSRGRGGPRCMSMPLYRDDLD